MSRGDDDLDRDRDRYLWDRTPPVDPEVAALEGLIGRFRHDGRGSRAGPRRRWPWLVGVAAVALCALGLWPAWPSVRAPAPGGDLVIRVGDGDAQLGRGEWVAATDRPRRLALDGGVGDFTLQPGSRLQIRKLQADETRFYLERGRLEAFVLAEARFFQVETPSTTCVDLGCRYVLTVDDAGDSHVVVTLGQVNFENPDGSEVYVPRGAECRASQGGGLGTPRFSDAPELLRRALDAFDDAPQSGQRRADLAEKLCAVTERARDSLSLMHLLDDRDERVARGAERSLVRLCGAPPGGGRGRAAWQDHLENYW